MPTWFLFLYFFISFGTCKGLWFNVTRGLQKTGDLFSNLDPSARCPNAVAGRSWCMAKKAECSSNQGCCICKCLYPSATFQMNVDPSLATCVGNSDIRSSVAAGCTTRFASEDPAHPLATLDLSAHGSKDISNSPTRLYRCTVKSAEYLNITWRQLPQQETYTFSIVSTGGWHITHELRWTGNMTSKYFGYIMKVNGQCSKKHKVKSGCTVFKAKGTLSRYLPDPTTQAPPVTTTVSATTKAPTRVVSTRMVTKPVKTTTQAKTTTQVSLTTRKTSTTASLRTTVGSPSTVAKTTSSTKMPSSKQTTKATNSPSTTSQKTTHITSHVLTDSSTESSHTTEVLPSESTVADVTTIEPTYRSVASKEPNKDQNKLSGEKDDDDSMMVAIVGGVAGVICVAIILLCVWLIISQRRKHRNGASFGTGTTVIANPTTTSSQNHFPMPGLLKNPVCEDSVYADPEEKVRKSAVGLLGNPSYDTCDDLLLKNPGAKDSQSIPLNNIQKKPLNTAKRIPHAKENTYDCADIRTNHGGKPNGEKSVYQSLVNEEARPRYKPEVNVPTYQSLNPDGLMYQPLIKNRAHKRQDEIPEYLALLNPSDSPGKISPSPPEYQPPYSTGPPPADVEESPEYADYADLDELEEISANEASNRTSDQAPSYSAPIYNVLEGPGCEYASAPMYAVLEGPDPYSVGNTNSGFEPPMYAVLEGPDSN